MVVVVVKKEEEEEEQVEEEGATSRCPRAAEGAQSSAGTKVGSPSITTQTVLLRRGLSVAALAPGTTALPWLECGGVLAWLDGGLSGLGSLCGGEEATKPPLNLFIRTNTRFFNFAILQFFIISHYRLPYLRLILGCTQLTD